MKRPQTQIKKPVLNTTEALKFATESIKTENTRVTKEKINKTAQRASEGVNNARVFFAPEGDKRLTINIREDLHKRLKIAAIEKEMTAGEIIEQLVEKYI